MRMGKEKTLEQRVAELERVVRELIEYKEEVEIIKCDENGKPLYRDVHDYNFTEGEVKIGSETQDTQKIDMTATDIEGDTHLA